MDADYRSSLLRRLRAVHSLYYDACATMSLEQVNQVVFPSAVPIAFSLAHQVLIEDATTVATGGPAPQFNAAWAQRIGFSINDHGKARGVQEMMHQRIEDFDAFKEFQRLVFVATEGHVATLDPSTLNDVLVTFPYPPEVANTFSARVGAENGISRSDALESWIYQHALRHMGEIEHARALVGLTGMTS
ncbi:MAG TPA: hypothetical protein VMU98_08055 [Acidimicrobiales bacterium]|nr:hypothetical protein [Acidimicrobiales bacterium]